MITEQLLFDLYRTVKLLTQEALRKLINDGIRSRSKANIVETQAFSERLEDAVARYHANAITTAEVLQELICLAKDIRAARQRGEESGLSDEEIAFYNALAENESAVQMMGDDKLRVIAHELLMSLRENVSVDWAHRESARARLRVLVKHILRKYGSTRPTCRMRRCKRCCNRRKRCRRSRPFRTLRNLRHVSLFLHFQNPWPR